MFGAPQHHHALEERGAGAARAHKQVEQCAGDGRGRVLAEVEAVLCGGDLEEGHLAAHVV